MHRLIILIALILMPARMICGLELSKNAPNEHTPPKLVEAWLRFHENELCQNADAVFIFDDRGMEAWYASKDDGLYQKLRDLFQAPNDAYRVEFYPTHRPVRRIRYDDEEGPPPNLYLNNELRIHIMELTEVFSLYDPNGNKRAADYKKWAIDARLFAYAEQIFDWTRKLNRYGIDLPLLAGVALDPSTASGTRSLAVSVCKAHAQNMEKILGKLEKNLKLAFPQAGKKERPSKVEKTGKTGITLQANADHISETTYNVVLHIRQFMYPSQHSVTLDELRRPSLLEDLAGLKRMVMDFQKALPSLPSRKAPAGRNSK